MKANAIEPGEVFLVPLVIGLLPRDGRGYS